jgi:TatD DNase family protein
MIDSHAHLMFRDFKNDLDDILKRAKEAGVTKIVNAGCSIHDSEASYKMCQEYDQLYGTLGVHPYDAADVNDALMSKFFDQAKSNDKIVAIGECGLDYHREHDKEDQKRAFRMHLVVAKELHMPVIIHSREAPEDTMEVIKEFPNLQAVYHCYPYDLDYAKELWGMGILTSFTGVATYPKADDVRWVLYNAPLDKIMIETDCPFLTPQKYRGQRNEPAYVAEVLKEISKVKGLDAMDLNKAIENTTREFFRI